MDVRWDTLHLLIAFIACQRGAASGEAWERISEVDPLLKLNEAEIADLTVMVDGEPCSVSYEHNGLEWTPVIPAVPALIRRLRDSHVHREMTPAQVRALMSVILSVNDWTGLMGREVHRLMAHLQYCLHREEVAQQLAQMPAELKAELVAQAKAEAGG